MHIYTTFFAMKAAAENRTMKKDRQTDRQTEKQANNTSHHKKKYGQDAGPALRRA